jgi:hypothetical protein
VWVSAFDKGDMRTLREAIGSEIAAIKRERAMADIVTRKTKSVLTG